VDVECVDEPQYMVDAPLTTYMYVTTNGLLPTLASRHYGTTVPHGCRNLPLLNGPAAAKDYKASPAKAVFVQWNLLAVGISVWPQTPLRVVRTLFVIKSGAKVLGAARMGFALGPIRSVKGVPVAPYIQGKFDSGPCPVRCWHG